MESGCYSQDGDEDNKNRDLFILYLASCQILVDHSISDMEMGMVLDDMDYSRKHLLAIKRRANLMKHHPKHIVCSYFLL